MANVTRTLRGVEDRWPIGTVVSLFKRSQRTHEGTMVGTAITTGTVQANGTVAFASVPDDGAGYTAVATVSGRQVMVNTGAGAMVSWGARR